MLGWMEVWRADRVEVLLDGFSGGSDRGVVRLVELGARFDRVVVRLLELGRG